MCFNIMALAVFESVSERFRRAWGEVKDTRKARGFDSMSPVTGERKDREFVDPADLV